MYASRDSGVDHTIKESNRHSFSTDLEQNKMLRVGDGGELDFTMTFSTTFS